MEGQEEPKLSQVVPVLVAALTCDVAATDPATGKKNLIGIFNKMWASSFPSVRPMSLYVKLSDAVGRYHFEVRLVQVQSGNILAKGGISFEVVDRLGSTDFFIPFSRITFPASGRYEFQIWANDTYLGASCLDIDPMGT